MVPPTMYLVEVLQRINQVLRITGCVNCPGEISRECKKCAMIQAEDFSLVK